METSWELFGALGGALGLLGGSRWNLVASWDVLEPRKGGQKGRGGRQDLSGGSKKALEVSKVHPEGSNSILIGGGGHPGGRILRI